MPMLENLTRQLSAVQTGQPVQPEQDSMAALVEAVKGVQLVVERGEDRDYQPALNSLGDALRKALKTHGDGLVKALAGISVNVEAPAVTVEAPSVTVNPEFEVSLPDPSRVVFDVKRDSDGYIKQVVASTDKPEEAAEPAVMME